MLLLNLQVLVYPNGSMRTLFLFFLAMALVTGCSDNQEQEPSTQSANQTVAHAGQETYMMYCAQCHGVTGDGTATIEIDRPARSFIDGGFSFGNTVHAISKTTTSGIPGTPMPPFAEVLTPEEIKDVSEYVRTFADVLPEATLDETELVVSNRPVVARGLLPSLGDGLETHPRGVMIGNPDRFSYEYDAEPVRLLAIRQGPFLRRADWGNRGGSALEILGRIVTTIENGNPNPLFYSEGKSLRTQLKSTNVSGKFGTISYDLIDEDGKLVGNVNEFCKPTIGVRTLVEQLFEVALQSPIEINTPDGSILVGATELPSGRHSFKIVHASVGGGS